MSARPKQSVPADLVDRLMATVRSHFCGNMEGWEWGKHSHFVRRNVILWPARFIREKGFTVTAERYEEIMRDVFVEIERNMTGEDIRYWPGYLMKCVQSHWKHHWEEYYRKARAAETLAESNLRALGRLPERSDGAVAAMAATADILAHKRRQKRKPAAQELDLPGF